MSGVVTVSRALTPRNWTSTSDPTNGWDAADGVRVGDHWYNTASGNIFVCVTNTVGAAVWRHIPRTWAYGASAAVTGTTAETVLATVSIPAGAIGLNGAVRVFAYWSNNNSGNNKTSRVRFGAASAGTGGTLFTAIVQSTNTNYKTHTSVVNRNSLSAQVGDTGNGAGGWSPAAVSWATATIATANASEVAITGQLANSADTLTLEAYTVELHRPDIT
jgi:hypothetical protein